MAPIVVFWGGHIGSFQEILPKVKVRAASLSFLHFYIFTFLHFYIFTILQFYNFIILFRIKDKAVVIFWRDHIQTSQEILHKVKLEVALGFPLNWLGSVFVNILRCSQPNSNLWKAYLCLDFVLIMDGIKYTFIWLKFEMYLETFRSSRPNSYFSKQILRKMRYLKISINIQGHFRAVW